jgi:hypothetical protein
MRVSPVELHIEELVLRGFSPDECYSIREAIEHELVRLLTEIGIPALLTQSSDMARLEAGSIDIVSGSKPNMVGIQVAQSVYQGLNR